MFRFLLLIAFFVSLYWIIAPPAFFGLHKRRNALIAALVLGFARFVVFTSAEPEEPKQTKQTAVSQPLQSAETAVAVPKPAPVKTEPVKRAASVQAILGKKSLFINIRKDGDVYCASDGPLWIVAELDNDFIAINGTARGWAKNGNLSVYRDNKWIKVQDRDINASDPQSANLQNLLEKGLALCSQSDNRSIIEDSVKRIGEGEKRYAELGKLYGLPSEKTSTTEGPLGRKTVRTNGFGCEDADRFDRIVELHGAGDSRAAQRLLTTSLLAEQCVSFKSGDQVFVEDISAWRRTRCVRPTGETTCYWTSKALIDEND